MVTIHPLAVYICIKVSLYNSLVYGFHSCYLIQHYYDLICVYGCYNHTIVLIGKGRAASEIKRPVKQSLMLSPRDRELSAKRHAIKKLENSLMETKRELSELKKENRLLNRLQIRQEKELNRFQTQEGELPEILARHSEEVGRKRNWICKYIATFTYMHTCMHLASLLHGCRIRLKFPWMPNSALLSRDLLR